MSNLSKNSRVLFGILLLGLSLFLVVFVGYAQTLKSYQHQTREAILAQAEVAKLNIEQVLSSGVPLQDIAGLQALLSPIADTDPSVVDLRLTSGETELYRYTNTVIEGNFITIPLNNKFSRAGSLDILLSDAPIKEKVDASFLTLLWAMVVLLSLFIWSITLNQSGSRYLKSFSVIFLTMTMLVVILVTVLLKQSLENKADSMANLIGHRLAPVLQADIDPALVGGMDQMLADFIRSNKEVGSLTVFVNDRAIARSEDGQLSQVLSQFAEYESEDDKGNVVHIAFHPEVLLGQLLKVLKSFAILFGGCAFVCFAFVKLLSKETTVNSQSKDDVLDKIKPLLLMIVLMEALMAPILPQFIEQVALDAGYSDAAASVFFSLYFLGFTLTLLPASKVAEYADNRRVLLAGICLAALGSLAIFVSDHIAVLLSARFISGVGQAAVFIAVQQYILSYSNQHNKTQATGIIVFCFNAGFIAGAAFGALLADMLGVQGIFALSAVIGFGMFLFAQWLPVLVSKSDVRRPDSKIAMVKNAAKELARDSARYLCQASFLRTLLLVGIPAKMLLTGVVFFAVPLLMADQGISKESVGQVLMTYAIVVLFVNGKVTPMIDRKGGAKLSLGVGSLVTVSALLLLGWGLEREAMSLTVIMTTLAMILLGLSHGLINAPVVTQIVSSVPTNEQSKAAATYRFLERIGHVTGAMLIGFLLNSFSVSQSFTLLAGFFVLAGLIFFLTGAKGTDKQPVSEVQS
ncbi:MFS transporter [Enterovibrio norvegicus FF-33]|uniref:MFS transporter n=1 Tax=Enterovibrio norvegicus TaxID=188144 RepID=UPI0002EBC069|nr:MFS transporter [Enterovibrio norvegicus]OEE66110.1 MFS transporter [Enterovibrio norvegicus FF-33]